MNEFFPLFSAINAEDIFEAYYSCRKHKRSSGEALEFEVDLESNLIKLLDEINSRTYVISPYKVFIVDKPVKREIFAASFRDRIVHHLLINKIGGCLEKYFIYDSYACRKGKGSHLGIARMHHFMESVSDNYRKEAWFLKLDIQGFFMAIDRRILYKNLEAYLLCNYQGLDIDTILYLVKLILFNDQTKGCIFRSPLKSWDSLPHSKSLFHAKEGCGPPIGNLTSQWFANFYLSKLDHFIKHELGIKFYGRYVDDFILMDENKENLLHCLERIKSFLDTELHLKLSPKKINLQRVRHGLKFLGVSLQPKHINMSDRLASNFNGCIKEINRNIDSPLFDKHRSIQRMNSYLGICSHYNTYRLRTRMLCVLRPDFFRSVSVLNDRKKIRTRKTVRKKFSTTTLGMQSVIKSMTTS